MKFGLIFCICFCVFATQAYPSPGYNTKEAIEGNLNSFLAEITERIRTLITDGGKMIALISELAYKIIKENNDRIQEHWEEILNGLSKLHGAEGRACITDIMPELNLGREILHSDVKECTQAIVKLTEDLQNDIHSEIRQIKQISVQLTKSFLNCIATDPKTIPACYAEAQKNASLAINEYFETAGQKILDAYDNALETADKAAMCVLNSYLRFDKIVNVQTQKAMDCLEAVPNV